LPKPTDMEIPSSYIIATADESRIIDSETVNSFGIDEFTLMEAAGLSAANEILKTIDRDHHGVFLCGKGNNGGDALVAARYLAQSGVKCSVVFISGYDDLSATTQKNFNLLQKINENDAEAAINFYNSWTDYDQKESADFIIDGMLGTGLNSDLRGAYSDAVKWANTVACPVYAMDIPTGLHADTGAIKGEAIRAAKTFAFGVLKQGFYLQDGHKCTGEIHFCELPFPRYIKQQCSTHLIDQSWVPDKSRTPSRHKYEAGVVYVIAGSEGMTGAAIMAAKSAWAEGVGAVILICPRGLLPVFEHNLPQIIKKPVGDYEDVLFRENHIDEVLQIVQQKSGVTLVGPGLGRSETTVNFVQQFLDKNMQHSIIDADALWALSQKNDWEKPESSSWILTPHPGELSTLLNDTIKSDSQRLMAVKEMAQQKDVFLLSKGFPVIVATPDAKTYLSSYDTRIFSRAGFGDVLAGKIAAYKSMEYAADESCFKALLSGYKKAISIQEQDPHHIPEPFDLI